MFYLLAFQAINLYFTSSIFQVQLSSSFSFYKVTWPFVKSDLENHKGLSIFWEISAQMPRLQENRNGYSAVAVVLQEINQ